MGQRRTGGRPVLETRDLWAGDPVAPACRGIDLVARAGEVLVVLGGPGAGKSQLLRCLGLDFAPLSGAILLRGVDISGVSAERRRRLRTEAIELVHPPAPGGDPDPTAPGPTTGFVLGTRRPPTVPVAGMRQRIQIAKALTRGTDVLLLDEPFAGVEDSVAARIVELVGRLRANGDTAVVVVTRDPDVAAGLADEVLVIDRGEVVDGRRSA